MPHATDLHRHLLTLDAHLDTPIHFARPGWHFDERHDLADDVAQLDLPRMEGNLSGGFFVIYTAQGPLTPEGYAGALAQARRRSREIDETLARFSHRIGPATTADDARLLHAQGRMVAFRSIENCYPIGEDLGLLAEFHAQGVRMAGPVHVRTNQLADSSTDAPRWNGLSPLGEGWVAEMNRLGMIIDASHASDAAFDRMLELSAAPLVLSHSGTRGFYDHPRNLDDGRIRTLVAGGGVIGFTTIYLSAMHMVPERAALFRTMGHIGDLSMAEQVDLGRRWNALDATAPMWKADFEDYMAALLHTIGVAGVDHVCFGADWDGGGGVEGFRDVTALPRVTERLLEAGFSAQDLEKMWSGNLLRVLTQAGDSAAAGTG
ncbi:dipeptidase [Niveispirillum fermenti]|uniref:dipeptidase n=1 Tax=Niveispirillum fermenti TaxID=1233113 RepID=UPI003A8B0872